MARLEGGIFSRPRGKTGGLVFGAARTRIGKVATSRLLVVPTNPRTPAQVTQRNKFSEALAITRLIGPVEYQNFWNRAIGQLPGFQSLESVYLNSLSATSVIGTIPPVNLGALQTPTILSVLPIAPSGSVEVTFSTNLGLNGTTDDLIHVYGVATNPAATPLDRVVVVNSTTIRDTGTVTLNGFISGSNVSVLIFAEGQGSALGLLSPTDFMQGNASV